ncbi:hypothetical protein N0K08_17325 [Acidovorax sp. Be4]|uniref:Uncharacterized protein n=1 Tax=Acidovorax bellezanensis TaxID=2976702 RepID=A0ABT2PT62_9BURK|nr:hypothetical protein [Acidovorax sp. Be4]MCT9812407.1 hypothetical protein [Acidovorax sp. Be4]
MGTNQLDPVSVAIALAGVLFGPALAGVIGPYAVIIISCTVGAGWALGRRDPAARLSAAWYFLRLNATAVIVTVGLARLAGSWMGGDDHAWLLAPIALIVGGVGDDWPGVGRWLFLRWLRFFERRAGGDGGST